jgi:acetoacetyl-CoA synthetase
MQEFMHFVTDRFGLPMNGWQDLYTWSVNEKADFWAALAEFAGIRFTRPATAVVADEHAMPGARWFVDSQLNFAENLLRRDQHAGPLIFRDERGRRRELSRTELAIRVAEVAAGLRMAGIRPGDRVAAILPNCPEAVIAMLAAASVGAVFSSCSPDFGAQAISDRFGQIAPRILFACDGYSYNGRRVETLARVAQLVGDLPTLEHVIVVPFLHDRPDISALPQANLLAEFALPGSKPEYLQLPFAHPLLIMYSSGTTGIPKCIVHSAGGTLVQHAKELLLHTDLSAADTIFYFTTCGWMMWNWLVSALVTDAAVLLYDGSPSFPHDGSLWALAAEEAVTVFGTSPRFLTATEKAGVRPAERYPELRLRAILSTGAPLAAESYEFVCKHVGPSVQLSSISGGTDIISCFALGNPLLPVYPGEIQSFGLGMAVDVYSGDGEPVRPGPGELVCTAAFPSMPLGFWNDPDGKRFHAAYFERFPGVWAHGDFAEITRHGGLIIHGRSDAVLNPGGVRIGTAEVCGPVLLLEDVVDCVAIGQRWQNDVRIVLFVVLQPGTEIDELLRAQIRTAIRVNASPRHVPAKILQVADVPRTISGKAVELAVRAIVHGEPVMNQDAIANPQALECYRGRAELLED